MKKGEIKKKNEQIMICKYLYVVDVRYKFNVNNIVLYVCKIFMQYY